MNGPYETTGAYRPDALAQLENTEPQWSDASAANPRCICPAKADEPEHSWHKHALHLDACPMYEQGGLGLGIAFIITLIGLFLFGLLQSGRHPDMRLVGSAAIVGALVLFVGVWVSSYRKHERESASSTTTTTKGLQQDTSGAHYQDGA